MGDRGGPAAVRVVIAERHRTVAQSLAALVDALGNAELTATVTTAADALKVTERLAPDVAIIDLDLSEGCSLVRGLKESSPDTRIVVLGDRSMDDSDNLVNALASGAVGAIYKEAPMEELARAVASSSPMAPVVADEATGVLLGSYLDALSEKRRRDLATIEALAAAVEVRDTVTGRPLHRVTGLATECMDALDPGLARNEEVSFGFLLHDVGKIGVPDAVLNKPGPLAEREWTVMRRHPELGVRIVEPIGFSPTATEIILAHHERWDGTGYPKGLERDEIPLTARVFAVADAFDAMTTDRPYRSALPGATALETIIEAAGSRYDPEIVDVFVGLTA
jgi:response regulator RpfG family c-di-GMP phosphodiesterase